MLSNSSSSSLLRWNPLFLNSDLISSFISRFLSEFKNQSQGFSSNKQPTSAGGADGDDGEWWRRREEAQNPCVKLKSLIYGFSVSNPAQNFQIFNLSPNYTFTPSNLAIHFRPPHLEPDSPQFHPLDLNYIEFFYFTFYVLDHFILLNGQSWFMIYLFTYISELF